MLRRVYPGTADRPHSRRSEGQRLYSDRSGQRIITREHDNVDKEEVIPRNECFHKQARTTCAK